MKFKKLGKEDMPIIIGTIVLVALMMISSAVSPTETGKPLSFPQWVIVNLAIIAVAFAVDAIIIKNSKNKRRKIKLQIEEEKDRIERLEKEFTIVINIKSGAIGKIGFHEMHQLFENDLFYFDNEFENLYEMVGYEWDGAKYKKIIQSDSKETNIGKTKANGLAGTGFGAVAGIGNAKITSSKQGKEEITEKEVEEEGSAIIRMKRMQDGRNISFIIECDSEIDKMIRCFNNIPE